MSLKSTALGAVLERLKGRQASRMQAFVAAVGAGVAVYKFLRSGSDDGEDEDGDEAADEGGGEQLEEAGEEDEEGGAA